MYDGSWGNTSSGGMNTMTMNGQGQESVGITFPEPPIQGSAAASLIMNTRVTEKVVLGVPNSALPSEVVKAGTADGVVDLEVAKTPDGVAKAPGAAVDLDGTEAPGATVLSEVAHALDAVVDVEESEVPAATMPFEVAKASDVQQKRNRKPTTRGEIMPLTTREAPLMEPEWFVVSYTYLEGGPDVKEWKDCVESEIPIDSRLSSTV